MELTQEHFDQQIGQLNSRLDSVDKRFDGVDQRFDAVGQRFDAVDQRFDGVDERFDGVDQRFDAVGQRFEGIDERFDGVDQHFDGIGERFDGVDKRFEGVATKKDLEQQTTELKKFAEDQTESLARIIATTIAEPMQQHFTEVKSELEMKKRVEELEHKMTKLQQTLHVTI